MPRSGRREDEGKVLISQKYVKQECMNQQTTQETLAGGEHIQWRTKRQMATHCGCDIRTISNFMRRRILPYVKIGHFVRFDLAECDKALARYQRKAQS